MSTELTTIEEKQVTPLVLIQQAIGHGMDPDQLSKLMDLQERHERNQAAQSYAEALTRFQAKCPTVFKGRKVGAGMNYTYASFDDVMREAGPILAECGLAVSFSTESNDRGIRVTVRIRHGIHTEESTLDVPVPQMKVNDTQRYGAALSYAKRYALCAALNIVVSDEDDDAASVHETVTQAQADELHELACRVGANIERFLKWCGGATFEEIPASKYGPAKRELLKKG